MTSRLVDFVLVLFGTLLALIVCSAIVILVSSLPSETVEKAKEEFICRQAGYFQPVWLSSHSEFYCMGKNGELHRFPNPHYPAPNASR